MLLDPLRGRESGKSGVSHSMAISGDVGRSVGRRSPCPSDDGPGLGRSRRYHHTRRSRHHQRAWRETARGPGSSSCRSTPRSAGPPVPCSSSSRRHHTLCGPLASIRTLVGDGLDLESGPTCSLGVGREEVVQLGMETNRCRGGLRLSNPTCARVRRAIPRDSLASPRP